MPRRIALCLVLAVIPGLVVAASAGATALQIFYDVQGAGVSTSVDGVGLRNLAGGSRTFHVHIGGPVAAANLFWGGRDRPCPESGGTCIVPSQPWRDQTIVFDSTTKVGTIIGAETQPSTPDGKTNNIGYIADVTTIVQAKGQGDKTFTFTDGDPSMNLNVLSGATLVVLYTDPADSAVYRVQLFNGLDFAHGDDPTPGAPRTTAPVAFGHGATAFARTAALTIFAGGGTLGGRDTIAISNRGPVIGCLGAADGEAWDAPTTPVTIPPGV